MHILLVNDDGIHSQGLKRLALSLAEKHEVTVVAPDGERSAIGHGITLRRPLVVQEAFWSEQIKTYAISGTPADCTGLGLDALTEGPVDLVISGPNDGPNTGTDLLYSGTVSAALEAAMLGKKALALSAPHGADTRAVVEIFLQILDQLDLEQDVRHALNINIPALPGEKLKGVRWAPQELVQWTEEKYERRMTPDGRLSYWPVLREMPPVQNEASDIDCLTEGYVSLTPLTFCITDSSGFREKEFQISFGGR